jgi:hypothetical protein
MNYNGYDVVEIAYETFAVVIASRCLCFAYRLRRRAARSPHPPSIEISGCDTSALPASAATVRPERRSAASGDKHAGIGAAANRRYRKQADEGRPALWNSSSEQAWFCNESVRAEFRLCRRSRFPAGNRGQRPVHPKNLPGSLINRPLSLPSVRRLEREDGEEAEEEERHAGQACELSRC